MCSSDLVCSSDLAHFKRIIQALDPDVIALQEHGEWEEIDDVIQSWFPNQQWHASWTYRSPVLELLLKQIRKNIGTLQRGENLDISLPFSYVYASNK